MKSPATTDCANTPAIFSMRRSLCAALMLMASLGACEAQGNEGASGTESNATGASGTVDEASAGTQVESAQAGVGGGMVEVGEVSLPERARSVFRTTMRERCGAYGARYYQGDEAEMFARVTALDFNGDSRADYIIMAGELCLMAGETPGPIGNAGPENKFLVSTSDGSWTLVDGFAGWIAPEHIQRRGERHVLVLPGPAGMRDCGPYERTEWSWSGNEVVAVNYNSAGQQVDSEGCPVRR
ncbi:MAG: hypothetical protein ACK4E3_05270 [Brevundimonas sp.]|jgi:hypothetical protein|uniref:hypothetical protein n=1 Tax=Brevundimonas sp. TaxID=1871086 RepID=UPI0039198790